MSVIRRAIALAAVLLAMLPAALFARAGAAWDRAALLEDCDSLCDTLREEYPFLPVLARLGIDAEALFARTRALAEKADSLDDFYALVDQLFTDMQNFAHLSWVTPENLAYYEAYADDATRAAYAAIDKARTGRARAPAEACRDCRHQELRC